MYFVSEAQEDFGACTRSLSLGSCMVPTPKAYPPPCSGFLVTHFPAPWCPKTQPSPPSPCEHCCPLALGKPGVHVGRGRVGCACSAVSGLGITVTTSAQGWQLHGIFSRWLGEDDSLTHQILSTSRCGGLKTLGIDLLNMVGSLPANIRLLIGKKKKHSL